MGEEDAPLPTIIPGDAAALFNYFPPVDDPQSGGGYGQSFVDSFLGEPGDSDVWGDPGTQSGPATDETRSATGAWPRPTPMIRRTPASENGMGAQGYGGAAARAQPFMMGSMSHDDATHSYDAPAPNWGIWGAGGDRRLSPTPQVRFQGQGSPGSGTSPTGDPSAPMSPSASRSTATQSSPPHDGVRAMPVTQRNPMSQRSMPPTQPRPVMAPVEPQNAFADAWIPEPTGQFSDERAQQAQRGPVPADGVPRYMPEDAAGWPPRMPSSAAANMLMQQEIMHRNALAALHQQQLELAAMEQRQAQQSWQAALADHLDPFSANFGGVAPGAEQEAPASAAFPTYTEAVAASMGGMPPPPQMPPRAPPMGMGAYPPRAAAAAAAAAAALQLYGQAALMGGMPGGAPAPFIPPDALAAALLPHLAMAPQQRAALLAAMAGAGGVDQREGDLMGAPGLLAGLQSLSIGPGGSPRPMRTATDNTQFQIQLEDVETGKDTRTTLMIRNIPNKYLQKMLLSVVNVNFKGLYDFFYLPIDFRNKCNVGYAFINFIQVSEFNKRKWDKFNSEKVCAITYARIQGKNALISHFQNSSLMTEDRKCRPLIFYSEGANRGEPEPFPLGSNVRIRRGVSLHRGGGGNFDEEEEEGEGDEGST